MFSKAFLSLVSVTLLLMSVGCLLFYIILMINLYVNLVRPWCVDI